MSIDARVHVERGGFVLDVEVHADPGEVLAVLGPNGAGKTTVLRVLAGLLPLSAGRVCLDGDVLDDPAADVFVPPQARPAGVVFQDHLLFPHLTARDNIAFGLRCRGRHRTEARQAADGWLATMGIADLADRRPAALSGGQAQRVALARALAPGPRLLLLDEPLAALDASTRLEVRAELRRHLVAYGGPTLVVTHDPIEAMVLADRLLIVEDGRLAQQGAPAEVARRPRTDYVARLVGLNLFRGHAHDGAVHLDGGGTLVVADRAAAGPALVAVRPSTVALHPEPPHGSPRNVVAGRVGGLEALGDRVRVAVDGTPPVLADVTAAAVADLRLTAGSLVWASVKATELEIYPVDEPVRASGSPAARTH